MDWDAYERKNGIYDPDTGRYWSCLSISNALTEIRNRDCFHTLGHDPEATVIRALQASRRDVEITFDQQHHIFPVYVRVFVRASRQIYDRNHDIYRQSNPYDFGIGEDEDEE